MNPIKNYKPIPTADFCEFVSNLDDAAQIQFPEMAERLKARAEKFDQEVAKPVWERIEATGRREPSPEDLETTVRGACEWLKDMGVILAEHAGPWTGLIAE